MDLLVPKPTALSSQTTAGGFSADSRTPSESTAAHTRSNGLCTPSISFASLSTNLNTVNINSPATASSPSEFILALGKLDQLLLEDSCRDVIQEVSSLLQMNVDAEGKTLVALGIADILSRRQRFADALNVLQGVATLPVSRWLQLWVTSMQVRLNVWLEQFDEAWEVTESQLPEQGREEPEDIGSFMQWLTGMMELNQWSRWREMKPRLEQFLHQAVRQNPALVLSTLENAYMTYMESGRVREAVLVQKLALRAVRNLQEPVRTTKSRRPQWRVASGTAAQTSRRSGSRHKASVISLESIREAHKLAESPRGLRGDH